MRYLNTRRLLQIWFSSDENVFLPYHYQMVLKKQREEMPELEMTLLVSRSKLSEEAKQRLDTFARRNQIQIQDFDALYAEHVAQDTPDAGDTKLFQHALDALGSNFLAMARDIATLLPQVMQFGTYKDIDAHYHYNDSPEYIALNNAAALLLPLHVIKGEVVRPPFHNTSTFLSCLPDGIPENYQKIFDDFHSHFFDKVYPAFKQKHAQTNPQIPDFPESDRGEQQRWLMDFMPPILEIMGTPLPQTFFNNNDVLAITAPEKRLPTHTDIREALSLPRAVVLQNFQDPFRTLLNHRPPLARFMSPKEQKKASQIGKEQGFSCCFSYIQQSVTFARWKPVFLHDIFVKSMGRNNPNIPALSQLSSPGTSIKQYCAPTVSESYALFKERYSQHSAFSSFAFGFDSQLKAIYNFLIDTELTYDFVILLSGPRAYQAATAPDQATALFDGMHDAAKAPMATQSDKLRLERHSLCQPELKGITIASNQLNPAAPFETLGSDLLIEERGDVSWLPCGKANLQEKSYQAAAQTLIDANIGRAIKDHFCLTAQEAHQYTNSQQGILDATLSTESILTRTPGYFVHYRANRPCTALDRALLGKAGIRYYETKEHLIIPNVNTPDVCRKIGSIR